VVAFDQYVADVVLRAVEPLLPSSAETQPLARRRSPWRSNAARHARKLDQDEAAALAAISGDGATLDNRHGVRGRATCTTTTSAQLDDLVNATAACRCPPAR
jgi:hypothetical protein